MYTILFLVTVKAVALFSFFYSRRDPSAGQHLGLHGVQPLALTDSQLDLHPVVRVFLEKEAIVYDELGVRPRTVEYVDLEEK